MKANEIQTLINEHLKSNALYVIDLLNNRIRIDSYDSYKELLKSTSNTYKNKITEFENECDKCLEKSNDFVNHCKEVKPEQVSNTISNDIRYYLLDERYSNEKRINTIFISSLDNTNEKSEMAITSIYKELGYQKLQYYIELLKNPSNLTSYLNDSTKQIVAMHYLLYKTGHHSTTTLSRNNTTKNLYNMMKSNIDDSIKEITNEKQDYIDFMNKEKENYSNWKENTIKEQEELKNNYDSFMEECNNRIDNLEKLYNKKLKVEKPAEFMKEKSEEYAKATKHWSIATIVMVIILMVILGIILSPKINVNGTIIEVNIFNKQLPIYESIILLALVCLIVYVLRVFIKLTISSKHLSEEYKQKYILTYFYLSLISEGKLDEELGNSVLSKLFTKADTGLIKNDTNIEIESIYKTLTGINK